MNLNLQMLQEQPHSLHIFSAVQPQCDNQGPQAIEPHLGTDVFWNTTNTTNTGRFSTRLSLMLDMFGRFLDDFGYVSMSDTSNVSETGEIISRAIIQG